MLRPLRVASVARLLHIAGDENRLMQTSLAFPSGEVEHTVFIIDPSEDMTERERRRWTDMRAAYADRGTEVVDLSTPMSSAGGGRSASVVSAARSAVDRARLVARLTGELRRRRIDVVDARMGLPLTLALPAAKAARVPVVTLTVYYTANFDPPVRYVVGQTCLLATDAIISDARATLDDFERWRWAPRSELVLIPNGIVPSVSALTRAEARAALGLAESDDAIVIGQVSRVMPRKAFDVFLRAAAVALEQRPDLHFAAIGFVSEEERPHLEDLQRLSRELGIDDRVTFVSYPGPVADAYRALDVFAHLSHADSSPFAIHEAMSAGVPSVITALPGNVELVDHERTGLLVPPADPDAAAAAMLRLVEDPELAAGVGHGAQARFDERHRPEGMAVAHLELYRRLLAGRSG